MPNLAPLPFDEATAQLGFESAELRVEKIDTSGTSNYVTNLNYFGQTWAAALRMPAQGKSFIKFREDKLGAISAASYLAHVLKGGVDVGFEYVLKFGGISLFVDAASTQAFLRRQSHARPLRLIDAVDDRPDVTIAPLSYPDALPADARDYVATYAKPFYLSVGAPANETLETAGFMEELREPIAHTLAALHIASGHGVPIPFDIAVNVLKSVEHAMIHAAGQWLPDPGSSEHKALTKSIDKWVAQDAPLREAIVRREFFLRSSVGKQRYGFVLHGSLKSLGHSDDVLRAFCHGDAHGGNFILVRYQYALTDPEARIDRVFLNGLFERNERIDEVVIAVDRAAGTLRFGLPSASNLSSNDLRAHRRRHHEIHLIDLDDSRGLQDDDKVVHLYDALLFALSVSNLSELLGFPILPEAVLRQYYEGLDR